MKKLSVISLGCDKNRIDTEHILYKLSRGDFFITDKYEDAEVIIINTCAFIEPARQEAIDTILEMAQYKKNGRCDRLIVTGCLVQKYKEQLQPLLPEVDAFISINDYDKIFELITANADNKPLSKMQRVLTTPCHYAYLRIADGCDNHCTFCTIPSIRGKYRSRPMEEILKEAGELVDIGVKEIILVAQDTTFYGKDLYNKYMLTELIEKLSGLDLAYIRLMYCYPELVSKKLIDCIRDNPKVAKYIDMPLQHIDDTILKRMNRRSSSKEIFNLMDYIRQEIPDIALRTTFMVGFPGETDGQFQKLIDFTQKYMIDNLGVFAYSDEEDVPSYKLDGKVDIRTKERRVKRLGEAYYEVKHKINNSCIGKIYKVLYEDIDFNKNLFIGRTQGNAPEIDTLVYFKADNVEVGNFYDVLITDYDGLDLIGEIKK